MATRVHQTVSNRSDLTGYRSNRSGPIPVWSGMKPVQIQNFNFNFKKMKNSQKILKNTSRCDESNGVKFSPKFVHLVWFAEFIILIKKKKKKNGGPLRPIALQRSFNLASENQKAQSRLPHPLPAPLVLSAARNRRPPPVTA